VRRICLHGLMAYPFLSVTSKVLCYLKKSLFDAVSQKKRTFFLRSSGGEHPTFSFLYKQGHGLYMSGTYDLAGGG
jgi:hypothetical protein